MSWPGPSSGRLSAFRRDRLAVRTPSGRGPAPRGWSMMLERGWERPSFMAVCGALTRGGGAGPEQTRRIPSGASPGRPYYSTGPLWEGASLELGRPILGGAACAFKLSLHLLDGRGHLPVPEEPREGERTGVAPPPALGVRHLCGLPPQGCVCRPTLMVWTVCVPVVRDPLV